MLSRSPMMSSFGLSGLPVSTRTDRLTASALVHVEKSSICFHVKSPSCPREDGVSSLLHVHVRGLVQPAEGAASRHADVDRREEDVQVLGVRDEDEESAITATLSSRKTASSTELTPTPSARATATILLAKATATRTTPAGRRRVVTA